MNSQLISSDWSYKSYMLVAEPCYKEEDIEERHAGIYFPLYLFANITSTLPCLKIENTAEHLFLHRILLLYGCEQTDILC